MIFSRFSKEKLLYSLISRAVIFLFVMCLLTLSLYTAGTVQGFIDSTQIFLLKLYEVLGIILVAVSFCGAVLEVERCIKVKKGRYLLRAGCYLFLAILGIVSVFTVIAIIAISEGGR